MLCFYSAMNEETELGLFESRLEWLWKQPDQHFQVADTFDDQVVLVKAPKGKTHFTCPLSIPMPSLWPEPPLLLRESSVHFNWDALSPKSPISTNGVAHPFETELFIGQVMFRSRNTPGTEAYFDNKRRLNSTLITGKFKRELDLIDVQTGQEFCKPVKQPSVFILKPILKIFQVLAPLLQVHIGKQTYFLSPLAQTTQIIQVTQDPLNLYPGINLEENFGEFEFDTPMSQEQRKKFLSSKKNYIGKKFRKDHFYSFDFYQDKLDLETFNLKVLGSNYDIQPYLKGQPIRILSRILQSEDNLTSQYLWNFELWHEKVVDHLLHK